MMLGLLREIIPALADHQTWLDTIFNLTDSIVDSVTPDVRRGEDLNINSYVDVITVPGGHLSDTRLVQGVVLRKEFVHRKMKSQDLQRPVRYLIIESGIGIEGDRTDKLAELGHIGEHEDKVLDFLLTRILSRRPDVLLLGAGICYAALKQLHAKGVLVVQNIEARKLQWIGRLTGAECLKSADYVTLPGVAYGNDPIGFSARFEVVRVQDDPEVCTYRFTVYTNRPLSGYCSVNGHQERGAYCCRPLVLTARICS
jgi:1-phosphatidylinositol-3-phosphate 5-kinase